MSDAFRNLREQTLRMLEAARSDTEAASLPALLAAREPLVREFAAAARAAGGATPVELNELRELEAALHALVAERRDRAARELASLRHGHRAADRYRVPQALIPPAPPRFLDRTH